MSDAMEEQSAAQETLVIVEREIAAQVNAALPALRQEVRELLDARSAPVSTYLSDLASDRYGLTNPVAVIIEHYEDEVTARWPEVEAFGAGDTESLAIAALRHDIVDLYLDLKETPNTRLGRNARAIKRVLLGAVVDTGNE
jgi:hypothetical protein